MRSLTKGQALFIKYLVDSDGTPQGQILAYRKAFPNSKTKNATQSASHRMLKRVEVQAAYQEAMAAKNKIISDARKKELQRQAIEDVISLDEADAILCKIITGKFMSEVKRPIWNPNRGVFEIMTVQQPPTAGEVTNAIDKFYKRYGANAAKKIMDVSPDTVIVPGDTDEPE